MIPVTVQGKGSARNPLSACPPLAGQSRSLPEHSSALSDSPSIEDMQSRDSEKRTCGIFDHQGSDRYDLLIPRLVQTPASPGLSAPAPRNRLPSLHGL